MSHPRPKWGQTQRFFRKRHYTIRPTGGDKIIVAPKDGDSKRTRQTVRIGHKCCSGPGNELLPCYVSQIKRAFGVTAEDILNDS